MPLKDSIENNIEDFLMYGKHEKESTSLHMQEALEETFTKFFEKENGDVQSDIKQKIHDVVDSTIEKQHTAAKKWTWNKFEDLLYQTLLENDIKIDKKIWDNGILPDFFQHVRKSDSLDDFKAREKIEFFLNTLLLHTDTKNELWERKKIGDLNLLYFWWNDFFYTTINQINREHKKLLPEYVFNNIAYLKKWDDFKSAIEKNDIIIFPSNVHESIDVFSQGNHDNPFLPVSLYQKTNNPTWDFVKILFKHMLPWWVIWIPRPLTKKLDDVTNYNIGEFQDFYHAGFDSSSSKDYCIYYKLQKDWLDTYQKDKFLD